MKFLKLLLDYVPAVTLMYTISAIADTVLEHKPDYFLRVLISLILAAAYTALTRLMNGRTGQVRSLVVNSPKFVRFYKTWYSKAGDLHIYCNDLKWLNGSIFEPIVQAILLKGTNAAIYLKDSSDEVAQRLIAAGVPIHEVPPSIHLETKFSLISDDGSRNIIIRNKVINRMDSKKSRNVFEESHNRYLTGIAAEFLELLRAPGQSQARN